MRLRRITDHLRDQNWFAVALDFVIVVIGVGAALMGQQWLSERQGRADYERALADVRDQLSIVYFASKERLAIAPCRQARYRELGELLMRTDEPWPGSPGAFGPNELVSTFPVVLRSPYRIWTSRMWDAELDSGTFDRMDKTVRTLVSLTFSFGVQVEAVQTSVRDMEASLQVLAYPLDMSVSDRLRYYDVLARADSASLLIEVLAAQNIGRIEATGLHRPVDDTQMAAHRTYRDANNARLVDIYGDCVTPMAFDYLEDPVQ
jgi:hypothetical protein